MKCKNRKRCGFYLAFGYCAKAIGENCSDYKAGERMSDLISRKKIRDYIKGKINPYGKPFEGTAYELALKIMRYIDAMDSDYSVEKVVEELELHSFELGTDALPVHYVRLNEAIEIVKQEGETK